MMNLNKIVDTLNKEKEIYLRVKALPGSGRNEILEFMSDDTLKIAIKAQAEKGKANSELIKFFAKQINVSRDSIKIISGAGARIKLIKIKL